MEVFLLIPVIITAIYGILLVNLGFRQNKAKSILGLLMFSAGYTSLALFFYFMRMPEIYIFFGPAFSASVLCFFPLLLKYMKNLSGRNLSREWVHFMPALIVFLFGLPLWLSMSRHEAIAYVQNRQHMTAMSGWVMQSLDFLTKATRALTVSQIVIYGIVMYREIRITKKLSGNYYSNLKGNELRWLQVMLLPMFLFIVVMTVFAAISNRYYFNNDLFIPLISLSCSLFFFMLGWFGIRQAVIVLPLETIKESGFVDKHETINLSRQKIESYFLEAKPYLNPDFKISDLSNALGINRTYVSNFINNSYGMNFRSFVNSYRIDEAKKKLRDTKNNHYSLEKVAEDCGFSSLPSFSRVFKEQCKLTPGKYRSGHNLK